MAQSATADGRSSCSASWSLPSDITSPSASPMIPPITSRVQPDRALLGHFRAALEWGFARFAGGRDPVCYLHDLERQPPRGLDFRLPRIRPGSNSPSNPCRLSKPSFSDYHIWANGSWTLHIPHQLSGIANKS